MCLCVTVQREEEDESDSNDTVCWLGQLIGAVVFAVLFGALGFVLCGGNERCGGSIIGQVCAALLPSAAASLLGTPSDRLCLTVALRAGVWRHTRHFLHD